MTLLSRKWSSEAKERLRSPECVGVGLGRQLGNGGRDRCDAVIARRASCSEQAAAIADGMEIKSSCGPKLGD